jgi:molybdate transport system permease protein
MDWQSLVLSLKLATVTLVLLLPIGLCIGRWFSKSRSWKSTTVQSLVLLPLILPPTVLGYYLLVVFGGDSLLNRLLDDVFGGSIAFSFGGLVLASIVFNLPLMVQPIHQAFENVPQSYLDAGYVCGFSPLQVFLRIELPLVWHGILSGSVLTFVHTLGEFGVVLIIGGNIPGETNTIESFDLDSANSMSLILLVVSIVSVLLTFVLMNKFRGESVLR